MSLCPVSARRDCWSAMSGRWVGCDRSFVGCRIGRCCAAFTRFGNVVTLQLPRESEIVHRCGLSLSEVRSTLIVGNGRCRWCRWIRPTENVSVLLAQPLEVVEAGAFETHAISRLQRTDACRRAGVEDVAVGQSPGLRQDVNLEGDAVEPVRRLAVLAQVAADVQRKAQ